MRTWTLVAAGLVAATFGAAAMVLPDAQTAATQQEQQQQEQQEKQKQQKQDQQKDRQAQQDNGPAPMKHAGGDGREKEVRRHIEVLGGRDVQIGVTIRDLEGDQARTMSGAVVADVRQDSPAAKAGLKDGDVIVEFDGEKVRSARHLSRIVGETAPGRPVKAVVTREGTRVDLQVTPEAGMAFDGDFRFRQLPNHDFEFNGPNFRFDGPAMRELFEEHGRDDDASDMVVMPRGRMRLGVGIQDLTPQLAEYFGTKDGVLVTSVERDSPAAKAGLRAGDVITAIGGTPVGSPSELTRAVRRAKDGSDLPIAYTRDKKSATATATLERREREPVRRKGAPI